MTLHRRFNSVFDILIVGGGIIGKCLALAISIKFKFVGFNDMN